MRESTHRLNILIKIAPTLWKSVRCVLLVPWRVFPGIISGYLWFWRIRHVFHWYSRSCVQFRVILKKVQEFHFLVIHVIDFSFNNLKKIHSFENSNLKKRKRFEWFRQKKALKISISLQMPACNDLNPKDISTLFIDWTFYQIGRKLIVTGIIFKWIT